MIFQDRYDAGRQLADRLAAYAGREDTIVLALPRGGVPVGYEVATAIGIRWTSSWSASSACQDAKSWRWERLRRAAYASSMPMSFAR